MAFPIAPIAITALKYGTVALTAYSIARNVVPTRVDQPTEDAFDDLSEGLGIGKPRDRDGQLNGSAKFQRTVRLGRNGPGIEIDAASLWRLRVRRVR